MRQLRGTRRLVPLYDLEDYLVGWHRLQTVFTAAGGHAWLFRSAHREDQFLEFLEGRSLSSLLERPEVAEALEELDLRFGEGSYDEWDEVRPSIISSPNEAEGS